MPLPLPAAWPPFQVVSKCSEPKTKQNISKRLAQVLEYTFQFKNLVPLKKKSVLE